MVISTGAGAPWIGGCFVTRWADPSTQSPDRSGHLVLGRSLVSNDRSHLEVGNWACLVAQMVKNPPAAQEIWVQSLGLEDLLEKEMATHSSILAWRIPQTEEPDRLQSMGSQRVGHDRVTNIFTLKLVITQIPLVWHSYQCNKYKVFFFIFFLFSFHRTCSSACKSLWVWIILTGWHSFLFTSSLHCFQTSLSKLQRNIRNSVTCIYHWVYSTGIRWRYCRFGYRSLQ